MAAACRSTEAMNATLTDGSRYQLVGMSSAAQFNSNVDILLVDFQMRCTAVKVRRRPQP